MGWNWKCKWRGYEITVCMEFIPEKQSDWKCLGNFSSPFLLFPRITFPELWAHSQHPQKHFPLSSAAAAQKNESSSRIIRFIESLLPESPRKLFSADTFAHQGMILSRNRVVHVESPSAPEHFERWIMKIFNLIINSLTNFFFGG